MQKTLEILKSEDGLVIKRLSYKKLLFVYKVPILLGNSDVVVGYLPVKIRYRTNKDNDLFLGLKDKDGMSHNISYELCDIEKLHRQISSKYQVKMNQIIPKSSRKKVIDIGGERHSFDRFLESFDIIDPSWIRNHKLENLI